MTVRVAVRLQVRSSAFGEGEPIPRQYTCDGKNISPPLDWDAVPDKTKSLAIVCDDPDAPSGTFTHWVLYDLPATMTRLAEGSSGGAKEGVNSFNRRGYGGPCPPPGNAHRYVFSVYALDIESLGGAGLSKASAMAAMRDHVLAEGELMGRYQRKTT